MSILPVPKAIDPNITTAALVEEKAKDPIALVKGLNAQAYNPGVDALGDLAEIRKLRDAGIDVYVWTVNDEPP